jgi:hypothetical protein
MNRFPVSSFAQRNTTTLTDATFEQETGNWKRPMRFGLALLAVLLGNIVYYLWLTHLPPELRHQPTRIDLGLGLDFLICLALWLLLTYFARRASPRK